MKSTVLLLTVLLLAAGSAAKQPLGKPMNREIVDGQSPRMKNGGATIPLKKTQVPLVDPQWDSIFTSYGYDNLFDNGEVRAFATDGDKLYLGGAFEFFNGVHCYNIIQYDRVSKVWSTLGLGFNGTVLSLAVHNGKLYAGGRFTRAGSNSSAPMSRIAEWNGTSWKQVGGGINGNVNALAVIDTSVYVGGDFSKAGSLVTDNIVRWDGSNWNEVDGGLNYLVNCMLVVDDTVFVGGNFYDTDRELRSVAYLADDVWHDLDGGFNGEVYSLAYFAGRLFAGGDIILFTDETFIGLVEWDGAEWYVSGNDTTAFVGGRVYTLYATSNLMYIGGTFSNVMGQTASGIAVYTTAEQFLPLQGGGVYGSVLGFGSFDDEIYVGGNFLTAGSLTVGHVAKLTHADVWQEVGPLAEAQGGYSETWISTIAPAGRYVFVGGMFTSIKGKPCNHIAMWDRVTRTWSSLGSGVDAEVWGITVYGDKVYAGGEFEHAGGIKARHVAYWDRMTQTWHAMGDGSKRFVDDFVADTSGIYASVLYEMGNDDFDTYIGRWDGSQWHQIPEPIRGYINTIVKSGDTLYIGGILWRADGTDVTNIAMRTPGGWHALDEGLDDRVTDLLIAGNTLYAGGWFTTSGSVQVSGIARWDDAGWTDIGVMNNGVRGLAWHNDKLYAAGHFTEADGLPVSFLASWDGATWSDVGGGTDYAVYDLAADDKSLFLGGGFSNVGYSFFSYRFAILTFEPADVADEKSGVAFIRNYPNPLNNETTICYSLGVDDAFVQLELYSPAGILVKRLVQEPQIRGEHTITVSLGDLPDGAYLCKLIAGGQTRTALLHVLH